MRSQFDVQFFRLLDRFDHRRCDAVNVLHRRLHALGELAKRVEIVAMNLDGDLRVDTGHHVTDEVSQWLFDFHIDTGDFLAKFFQ